MRNREQFQFGEFQLFPEDFELLRDGRSVRLERIPFRLLVILVEHKGQVVSRDEIAAALWADNGLHDLDQSLNTAIRKVRQALHDSADNPVFLQTIVGRGYRFLAPVTRVAPPVQVADPPEDAQPASGPAPPASRTGQQQFRWIYLALCVLLVPAAVWLAWPRKSLNASQELNSLIVLPFTNLGPDSADEYLADGLTEELIHNLTNVPGLRVAARSTSFRFKGKAQNLAAIGRQLNVDGAIEGSVRRDGHHLVATVQLIAVRDGFHVWSRKWDRAFSDTLNVQREIAAGVTDVIKLHSNSVVSRNFRAPTENMEAYNLYLQGRFQRNRVFSGGIERAIGYFRQAIEKDPNFAGAHAALADAYTDLGYVWHTQASKAFPIAEREVATALDLDSSLASGHTTLGLINLIYRWDWASAERELKRGIELDPSDGQAHHFYAHYLIAMRRFDEAEVEVRRAIEVDALNMDVLAHTAWHYNMMEDFEAAQRACERALGVDPAHFPTLYFLRTTRIGLGDFEGAMHVGEKLDEMTPESVRTLSLAVKAEGPQAYWRDWLKRAIANAKTNPVDAATMARLYTCLGQTNQALDWLERGYREHQPWMVYLQVDPYYKDLRDTPRFKNLVAKMAFPKVAIKSASR